MNGELTGRVALVTGAARNIGRAIALDLAEAGAAIVLNARTHSEDIEAGAGQIRAAGGKAHVHPADVSNPAAVDGLMRAAADAFGGLDILVCNAAIRREAPFNALDYTAWREVTSVILDGAYLCSHAALPYLCRSEAASIVLIGGMSAHTGSRGRAHVVAAKAGIVGLTRALAHDLAPDNITVNCVAPGLIDTAREASSTGGKPAHHDRSTTLVGRRGRPEEVAAAVRYLVGPNARYVTGQTLHVNGGAFLA